VQHKLNQYCSISKTFLHSGRYKLHFYTTLCNETPESKENCSYIMKCLHHQMFCRAFHSEPNPVTQDSKNKVPRAEHNLSDKQMDRDPISSITVQLFFILYYSLHLQMTHFNMYHFLILYFSILLH
jgi:hypothetical protein